MEASTFETWRLGQTPGLTSARRLGPAYGEGHISMNTFSHVPGLVQRRAGGPGPGLGKESANLS